MCVVMADKIMLFYTKNPGCVGFYFCRNWLSFATCFLFLLSFYKLKTSLVMLIFLLISSLSVLCLRSSLILLPTCVILFYFLVIKKSFLTYPAGLLLLMFYFYFSR